MPKKSRPAGATPRFSVTRCVDSISHIAENPSMTVTLSSRIEEIIQAQLKTGRYATPDEVVSHLIEKGYCSETLQEIPPALSESELKSSLLQAVSKPTRPFRKGEFVELARRAIAEARGG